MDGKFFEKQVVTHKMTKQRTKEKQMYQRYTIGKLCNIFINTRNANRVAKLKELQNSEERNKTFEYTNTLI